MHCVTCKSSGFPRGFVLARPASLAPRVTPDPAADAAEVGGSCSGRQQDVNLKRTKHILCVLPGDVCGVVCFALS